MERKTYFFKTYLFMTLICCVSCENSPAPRVSSGSPASISQFPYIVGVRNKHIGAFLFGAGHICGGSLISSSKILSAAHCFYPHNPPPPSDFLIALGITRRNDKENAFLSNVKKYKVHENYQRQVAHDIAVAILENPVPADHPVIKPIKLPLGPTKAGTRCKIAGWGITKQYDLQITDELLQGNVPVVSNEECEKILNEKLNAGFMCAGGESTQSSCLGDSGGPLTCNNVLAGVVSWGTACGDPKIPIVYANVFAHMDWINGFDERSKGVSSFRSNVVTVFYTLLVSLSWYCIKK